MRLLRFQCHDKESYILSDKTKLHKILSNLIENAIKYTNDGFIELGYYIGKMNLILFVKDTGIGISPENHQIIFDRFSQEEKEMTRKHGGLGLGLSISKENAHLLGGDISLESEKGKGSTFYVTLPYKQVLTDGNNTAKNIEQSKFDKFTILVAEDEEVNYLYIEALFEDDIDGNCNLIHAKNGQEAVAICTPSNNIDLVLMDIYCLIDDILSMVGLSTVPERCCPEQSRRESKARSPVYSLLFIFLSTVSYRKNATT